jgi:hypothetical protein
MNFQHTEDKILNYVRQYSFMITFKKNLIPYALNFIPSILNIMLHHDWAKNGKVDQKNSLLKSNL